jgi:hypothetical protein
LLLLGLLYFLFDLSPVLLLVGSLLVDGLVESMAVCIHRQLIFIFEKTTLVITD